MLESLEAELSVEVSSCAARSPLDEYTGTDQRFSSLVRDLSGHGGLGEYLYPDCQKYKQDRN